MWEETGYTSRVIPLRTHPRRQERQVRHAVRRYRHYRRAVRRWVGRHQQALVRAYLLVLLAWAIAVVW
jgi:hypothetical protein